MTNKHDVLEQKITTVKNIIDNLIINNEKILNIVNNEINDMNQMKELMLHVNILKKNINKHKMHQLA